MAKTLYPGTTWSSTAPTADVYFGFQTLPRAADMIAFDLWTLEALASRGHHSIGISYDDTAYELTWTHDVRTMPLADRFRVHLYASGEGTVTVTYSASDYEIDVAGGNGTIATAGWWSMGSEADEIPGFSETDLGVSELLSFTITSPTDVRVWAVTIEWLRSTPSLV